MEKITTKPSLTHVSLHFDWQPPNTTEQAESLAPFLDRLFTCSELLYNHLHEWLFRKPGREHIR